MFPKSTLLPLAPARGTVSGGDNIPTTCDAQDHTKCSGTPCGCQGRGARPLAENGGYGCICYAFLAGARGGGPDHSPVTY